MNNSISVIVVNDKNHSNCPILTDRYNLGNEHVKTYLLNMQTLGDDINIPCEHVLIKDNILLTINDLKAKLNTDYVILVSSDYTFEYDTALLDAITLAEQNDVVCLSTQYAGDGINKFSRDYINYMSQPTLSDLLLHPSAFVACVFSTKVFQTTCLRGNDIATITINCLIDSFLSGNKCAFIPLHILHTNLKSHEVDDKFDTKEQINSFLNLYPLLNVDYQMILFGKKIKPSDLDIVINKIQKTCVFRMFMKFRESLKRIGYYDKKAAWKYRKYLKQVRKDDAQLKEDIAQKIEQLPLNMLKRSNDESDIVISLTTHGKRLEESAPYGIYSLFTQTVLPNRIVINVNQDVWNEDNLPYLIKRLMKSGLEVNFCKDIRSHTKFIPALKLYPNNPIITVDDDMCYEEHMIEELVTAYNSSDKKTIFCRQGVLPKKKNGKYIPYMQWDDTTYFSHVEINGFSNPVSPYGVHGVVYPPHIFDDEIYKDEIFLKLAPHTDDIWFWLMEVRAGVKVRVIQGSRTQEDGSVSLLEYLEETESTALYFQNCFNGRNDKEMYALLEYYGLN